MFNATQFKENLSEIREKHHFTLQTLAVASDMSVYTLRDYVACRATPTVQSILKLCDGTGESPNAILEGMVPSKTELGDVDRYLRVMEGVTVELRPFFHAIIDAVINCFVNSHPSLIHAGFGARVTIFRSELGMSPQALCRQLQIERTTLANIESGGRYPSLDLFLDCCEVLHVSPELLLANGMTFTTYPEDRFRYLTPYQIAGVADVAHQVAKARKWLK